MKKLLLLSAVFGGAVFLSACGGSGSTTTAQTDSQKVGTLKIGVKFPSSGELNSQFIDPNIQCIEVSVYGFSGFAKSTILTPDNPQATISGIPVGDNFVGVRALDGSPNPDTNNCTGAEIDYASAYAEIVEGTNQFTINLLRAKWTFVDQNNNPVSINLNGTLSTSTESIDGFYVVPWSGFYPASIDTTKPAWGDIYDVVFFGSNLNACNSTDPTLCPTEGYYTLQLIGPSTSNNAFDTDSGVLQPGSNNEPRVFMIVGTPPCYGYTFGYESNYSCSYNFSNSGVETYINTTVTASDTMQGHIAELMIKNITESATCYTNPDDPQGSQVNCPSGVMGTSKAVKSALNKALAKSQLTAAQTCMQDVTLDMEESWRDNTAWHGTQDTSDIDGDGNTWEYVCDNDFDGQVTMADDTDGDGNIECWSQESGGDGVNFYVNYSSSTTMDVCFHPFTAKAQAIPTGELSLIIQKR